MRLIFQKIVNIYLKYRIKFKDYSDADNIYFRLDYKNNKILIKSKKEISIEGEKYQNFGIFDDKCRLFTLEFSIINSKSIISQECINLKPQQWGWSSDYGPSPHSCFHHLST